jgi:ArsR family transcriptional regulator, virulence genes transcriptional regulator
MTKPASRRAAAAAPIVARMGELQRSARRAAPLLKAMSNPSRLVILCQLAEGERSVGALEEAVGLSQSGISQHLAILRREHAVVTRRDKQTVYYSLASPDVMALMATLHRVFCKPSRPAAAKHTPALQRRARA